MPSNNDTHLGETLVKVKPASIKQLNDLARVQSSHACTWWMSEHTLELGALKHAIRSSPRDQVDSCLNELGNHNRIAVLPIETNQSCLWWESEVRQVGLDSLKRRSQFTLIVAIASILIRADPLTSMHLKRCGPCAHDLTPLPPDVTRRTDGIEAASCRRKHRIAR